MTLNLKKPTIPNRTITMRPYDASKLPPQATDLEEGLIGCALIWKSVRDEITFLKPEHFCKDSHQDIYRAIQEVEVCTIESVGKSLKSKGLIEKIGGYFALSKLKDVALNPALDEWAARIILQCFIRRELIRIGSQTIQEAYEDTTDCITLFDNYLAEMETIESIFMPDSSSGKIISSEESEAEILEAARNNEIKMGLSTGYPVIDAHFVFKPASFVIFNGTDNSGKTTVVLYLAILSALKHGWKWILATLENAEAHVRIETIQLATGKPISRLNASEYEYWLNWSRTHFVILSVSDQITGERLLRIAQKINAKKEYSGFLIDPYNALDIDIENSKMSSHEYHYRMTGLMRNWIKRNDCCIYLNTHAVTEALRRLHKQGDYEGFPMPPEKADVEGGGKFANRADDFLTIHRYNQHPTEFNVTQIHVRKIKMTQTGGRPTSKDEPIKLRIPKGYFTFCDMDGFSPIVDMGLPKIITQPAQNLPYNEKREPDF